jgi:hypothetical protein
MIVPAADLRTERYTRAQRLPFRRLDDQTVIVDPGRREVHVLNGVGSAIWDLLSESRNLVDLVAALEHEGSFDAEFATISDDVRAFLIDLSAKGLVTVESPPAAAAAAP